MCGGGDWKSTHHTHHLLPHIFEILLIIIMEAAAEAEAMDILRLANVSLNENFTRIKTRNENKCIYRKKSRSPSASIRFMNGTRKKYNM